MAQKLVIEVDTNKPLSSFGDSHIIFYNEAQNKYYVTTYESFLKPQSDAIKKITLENETLKKNYDNFIKITKKNNEESLENFEKRLNEFMENMDKKYAEFLKVYKETNAKLINMVKTVVIEEE